jgi:hypothetical protein
MRQYATVAASNGRKNDPSSKTGSATTTKPSPLLVVARENCLALNMAGPASVIQIAKALAKQYPDLQSQVVPLVDESGHVLLQFSAVADPTKLLAGGLVIGSCTHKAHKLLNTCQNSSTLHCQLLDFLPDEEGTEAIKAALEKWKVVTWMPEYYEGTKVSNGVVNIILDLNGQSELPPATLKVAREKWTEEVKFRIIGKHSYCHYCRVTSHSRNECTKAPACKNCNSHQHPTQKCKSQAKQPFLPSSKAAHLPKRNPGEPMMKEGASTGGQKRQHGAVKDGGESATKDGVASDEEERRVRPFIPGGANSTGERPTAHGPREKSLTAAVAQAKKDGKAPPPDHSLFSFGGVPVHGASFPALDSLSANTNFDPASYLRSTRVNIPASLTVNEHLSASYQARKALQTVTPQAQCEESNSRKSTEDDQNMSNYE